MKRQRIRIPKARRSGGALLFALAAVILFAVAQPTSAELAQSHSVQEEPAALGGIPMEVIQRPIPLRGDLSTVRHPVSTESSRARAYHEQGLTYLHLYGYLNAARSFHAALRLDPDLAAARMGLALAYRRLARNDPDGQEQVREMAARAVTAVGGAPDEGETNGADGEWVRLHAARLGLDEVPGAGDADSIRKLVARATERHPGDTELLMLKAGGRPTDERKAVYHEVLANHPDHPGAHHMLVHLNERRDGDVSLAVEHGEALARLAPSVAHARHMWGHNLRRVGRVAEAIREFEAARDIEHSLERAEGIPVRYDWHHPHNLALLGMSYHHQGRIGEAETVFRELAKLPAEEDRRRLGQRMSLLELQLTQARWNDARAQARRWVEAESALLQAAGHLYKGFVHLGSGAPERAAEALAEADHHLPDGRHPMAFHESALTVLLSYIEDQEPDVEGLEELLDDLRARPGPDAWARAHMHMEILAQVGWVTRQLDVVDLVAQALREHDPHYPGGRYWTERLAAERSDPGRQPPL